MEDYNAEIIYKCFSNKLDYIYGLRAIKSELKLRNKIKKCGSCNRKYFGKNWKVVGHNDNWCDTCNEPNKLQQHMKFHYHKILTNTNKTNYFDYVPNEIISLIFDNLSEYEVMNFYIAIQNCDRENFKKIACWAQIRCGFCKSIKKKYFKCWYCDIFICSDCTEKCAYCDDMVDSRKKKDLHIDNTYYLDDYENFHMDISETCLDDWSSCIWPEKYVGYIQPKPISNKEYNWSVTCITCNKKICYNCIGDQDKECDYNHYCKTCSSKQNDQHNSTLSIQSLEVWPTLK